MKKFVCAAALAAALMSVSSFTQAAEPVKRGGFLAQMDLDFGGDDIATLAFTNGDTQNVKAGQGLGLGIGGWFRPVESVPFELQGILGYKVVWTAADNADIKMTRTTRRCWSETLSQTTRGSSHACSGPRTRHAPR
jgi:opacity protein-like surface antigen